MDRDGHEGDGRHDDVEALIAERRAANPRHSPGREPSGADSTRRLLTLTAAVVGAATVVLAIVLLLA